MYGGVTFRTGSVWQLIRYFFFQNNTALIAIFCRTVSLKGRRRRFEVAQLRAFLAFYKKEILVRFISPFNVRHTWIFIKETSQVQRRKQKSLADKRLLKGGISKKSITKELVTCTRAWHNNLFKARIFFCQVWIGLFGVKRSVLERQMNCHAP